MVSRLVLGTVQLGMAYGVNNRTGQPSLSEARAIINEAWKSGIREFDTAQAYGASEEVLGQVFADLGISREARVISKIDPAVSGRDIAALDAALARSLEKLKVPRLAGLMLHHEQQLDDWNAGLGEWFARQRECGLINAAGASVYTPVKALQALEMKGIGMVQMPSNILDRRFAEAGIFCCAEDLDKNIYIRSVLVQGLLAMAPDELPEKMAYARPVLEQVRTLADRLKVTVTELCFAYAAKKWPGAKVVFGAETVAQVRINTAVMAKNFPSDLVETVEQAIGQVEERIFNPLLWPR